MEIKDGSERKYKWTAEIKDGKKKKEEEVVVKRGGVEKNYKWTAEIKGRGEEGRPITKTYTFKAANGDDEDVDDDSDCVKSKKKEEKKKEKKKKKKEESHKRTVEIEELGDHRAVVLRQVFWFFFFSCSDFCVLAPISVFKFSYALDWLLWGAKK